MLQQIWLSRAVNSLAVLHLAAAAACRLLQLNMTLPLIVFDVKQGLGHRETCTSIHTPSATWSDTSSSMNHEQTKEIEQKTNILVWYVLQA